MGQTKKSIWRNFIPIIIVSFGGAIIYGLPYFRYDYYDAYLQVYNLTDTQMGVFGSVLGVFGMISYLFGGIVADRFSTRAILTLSLIGTGLGGFIHLLPLNFTALVCLYAFWGVSSLFAFWPCCVKAVRILSDSGSQGKAFGFFEGGRGVAAALMAMGAVIAYKIGIGHIDDQVRGMKFAIIFYSVLTIAMGIITFFVVKNDKMDESEKVSFKGIGELLRMPAVWIVGFLTFFTYMFTQLFYYFTPYMTEILGASVTIGAALAASRRWFSLLGNVGGGIVTDKVGTTKMIFISFIVIAVGVVAMILLPEQRNIIIPFIILYILIYIFYNVNYAMTWALMDEGGIPERLSGSAAGLISTIGYLPEIFCSLMAGRILDLHEGATGYKIIFTIIIVSMLLGAVLTLIWKRVVIKKQKES
jgi:nitrate/nitrite transporter NarK